jgi:dTDP-4-dehydrorhamnose reductase
MRVIVLGGDGMLGHQVTRRLSHSHEVVATVRKPPSDSVSAALAGCRIVTGLDVRTPGAAESLVLAERPKVVVNAVGIVKQRAEATDPLESIEVNSLFPHRLARACAEADARVIHISTDCVFSGSKGDYKETDNQDPVDLYGRSKLLGEVSGPGCLTIRTSMVGLELSHCSSLVEWFLAQSGDVRGYTKAMWNGLTTIELARVIDSLIAGHPHLQGIWHVSGPTVSKYDLLARLAVMIGRRAAVVPDDSVVIDRTLNSDRFKEAVSYVPPTSDVMLSELAAAVRERETTNVV